MGDWYIFTLYSGWVTPGGGLVHLDIVFWAGNPVWGTGTSSHCILGGLPRVGDWYIFTLYSGRVTPGGGLVHLHIVFWAGNPVWGTGTSLHCILGR